MIEAYRPDVQKRMKQILDMLKGSRERSLAGLCYDLGLEFRNGKNSVEGCIDNLCEIGFCVAERETENNNYYSLLESSSFDILYKQIFAGGLNETIADYRQLKKDNGRKVLPER